MSISILDQYIGAEELGLDTQAVAEEVAEVAAEAVRAEVAELAVEVEESSAQVEELVDAVNDLEEAAEEIAENVEGMESLLASGNYNSVAMANLYKRTNALAVKLGGGHEGSVLGAESISDASMAEMMAREGIESFMETAKRWGKKAIEFIKHIFNTVINFFVGLVNQAGAIQRRAEQLKARIKDGSSIKKGIKTGNWALWLGKTKAPSKFAFFSVDAPAQVASFVGSVGTKPSEVTVDKFSGGLKALVKTLKTGIKVDASSVKEGETTIALIGGGVRLTAKTPDIGDAKTASELSAAARKIGLSYSVDADAKKKVVGVDAPDVTAAELTSECDVAIKAATGMKEANVKAKFTSAQRDQLIGSINAVHAGTGESAETAAKENKEKIQMVQAAYATSAKLLTTYGKINAKIASARLDRVAAYLAFGKDAEEKKTA